MKMECYTCVLLFPSLGLMMTTLTVRCLVRLMEASMVREVMMTTVLPSVCVSVTRRAASNASHLAAVAPSHPCSTFVPPRLVCLHTLKHTETHRSSQKHRHTTTDIQTHKHTLLLLPSISAPPLYYLDLSASTNRNT